MRRFLVPLVLFVLVACGDAFAKPAPAPIRIADDAERVSEGLARRALLSSTLARFTFDAPTGEPDPQGWEAVDLTDPGDGQEFWSVDDFAGLSAPYAALEGQRSLWCGLRPDPSDPSLQNWVSLPGYGNGWNTAFVSQPFTMFGPAWITFDARWSTEAGFDRLELQVKGSMDTAWVTLATYEGEGAATDETVDVPQTYSGDQVRLRFRFLSDANWSDEDGDFDSTGAVVLDDIEVHSAGQLVDHADFEGDPVGAQATANGFWTVEPGQEPFGLFTGLVPADGILQDPSREPNPTNFWTFFQGSTDTYRCGVVPSQPAVPRPIDPADPTEDGSFANEIRSPWIALDVDENGSPVVDDAAIVELHARVYRDLRYQDGVFYIPRVRFRTNGVESSWRTTGFFYYGPDPSWASLQFDFPIPPGGAADVQVAIMVRDSAWALGDLIDPEACHTHGPMIDDVTVRVRQPGLRVTNTNSQGDGSLINALYEAAANDDLSVISFDIEGSPSVIQITGQLPELDTPIVLDGRTDPDWVDDPVIEIAVAPGFSMPTVLRLHDDVTLHSIAITGATANGVTIQGDRNVLENVWIGRSATGADVGVEHAVEIQDGAQDNRVGGIAAGQGCLLANTVGDGVRILGDGAVGNAVRGNSFLAIGAQAIDLGGDGDDPDGDDLDADTGPNGRQNFPEIEFASGPGGAVEGILRSAPDADFEVDVYVSADCGDFFDSPPAEIFVGSATLRTGGDGVGWFRFEAGVPIDVADVVTATATDAAGNTSEVGACVAVPNAILVTTTADSGPGSLRQAIVEANGDFEPTIAFAIDGPGPHTITPLTSLPVLQRPVVIDGFSQTGASPNTRPRGAVLDTAWQIALDGSVAGGDGLVFGAGGALVRGLVVHDFPGRALSSTFQGMDVEGCAIGVDLDGDPAPNGDGVHFEFRGGGVGGRFAHQRNLIAHNTGDGVYSFDTDAEVRGNVFHDNGGLAFDIRSDGPSSGSGVGTDPPSIAPAVAGQDFLDVTFVATSSFGGDDWIEVYASTACDASGSGEGRSLLLSEAVAFYGSIVTLRMPLETPLLGGEVLTAIYHDDRGDGTSEFSSCVEVANTPVGTNVVVEASDGLGQDTPVTVVFENVVGAGRTLVAEDPDAPAIVDFDLGAAVPLDVTTTASFAGLAEVCVEYDPAALAGPESAVVLLHYDTTGPEPAWGDVTTSRDPEANLVCGSVASFSPFAVAVDATATSAPPGAVAARALSVFPNPFNPRTSVAFSLARADAVKVEVFDLTGRRVRTLHDGRLDAGSHTFVWNGEDAGGSRVASGVYLVALSAPSRHETRKIALVR